jgi:branched-chain amino acid transport system substrate-binding protein
VKRCLVSAVGLLVLLAGCSPTAGPPPPKQGRGITIGVPLAASGDSAQEGALTRQGYDLWLDWANRNGGIEVQGVRHRVRLLYQDDTSVPQVSARLTQQMVSQSKVDFLLGPYGTTNTAAAAAVGEQAHVPMVASNAAAREIFMQGYRYLFGVLAPAATYPQAVIDMALTMNPRPVTVAALYADDLFSVAVNQAATAYAVSKGLKVVYQQRYPSGLTDFHTLIQQAKAKNPDVLLNAGHLLESVAVNKAAMDLQLNAKIFVYAIGPAAPQFVQALGKSANYVVTASPWTAQAKYKASYYLPSAQYVAAYKRKFHTALEPSFVTADATAAGVALQAAIEHAQSLNADKVRNALASLDIDTFYGRIRFDPQGENSYRSTLVVQIQDGQQLTVWPPELATAAPQLPTPTWVARLGLPATPPKAKLPGTGAPPARRPATAPG